METPPQLETLHSASPWKDQCRALAGLAELLGAQRPSCEAMSDHRTGGYDIAAVVTTMCGVFGEVNSLLKEDSRRSLPDTDDAVASHRSIIEPALAVVAALPPFSEVISPVLLSDVEERAQAEPGHATSRGGDFLGQFDGLLDNVMGFIEQVTEAVCTMLSCTCAGGRADLVLPLYRLITGWECAFRGKADCLRIVDQLFRALLGHGRCCEDPAPIAGEKDGHDTAPPLWLSDRLQHTLDVYHCIVATFEATQGPDFNEWVMTTPYWVTLLNIAAGHTCAFKQEDVVSETMPARHDAGLLMLGRLASSPFADLAVTTATTLLLSAQVWETGDAERNELDVAESLFFVDTENQQ